MIRGFTRKSEETEREKIRYDEILRNILLCNICRPRGTRLITLTLRDPKKKKPLEVSLHTRPSIHPSTS